MNFDIHITMYKKIILEIVGVLVIGALVVVVHFFFQKNSPSDSRDAAGSDQYASSILTCYPKSQNGVEYQPIPNNSVQYVKETSRLFINMPKNLYQKYILRSWTTIAGNATSGYISNDGLPGKAMATTSGCWSTYMEFDGNGEVDLRVKSIIKGVPDYFVRFIVSPV